MSPCTVLVDDAHHALRVMAPMWAAGGARDWRIVLCVPALPRHAARHLGPSMRAAWADLWAERQQATLMAAWPADVPAPTWLRTAGPVLPEAAVDARRTASDAASGPRRDAAARRRWSTPLAATASLGALLMLAD